MTATLMHLTHYDLSMLYSAMVARQRRLAELVEWYETRNLTMRAEQTYAKWAECGRMVDRIRDAMEKTK